MTLRRRSFLRAWRLDRKKWFFLVYNIITYTCKLLNHQILIFFWKVSVGSHFCITLKFNFCILWPAQQFTAWIHFTGETRARWNWWTEPSCRHAPLAWFTGDPHGYPVRIFEAGTYRCNKQSLRISVSSWNAKKRQSTNMFLLFIFVRMYHGTSEKTVKLFGLGQWSSWWLLHWTGGRDVLSTLGGGRISKRLEASIPFWCLWNGKPS